MENKNKGKAEILSKGLKQITIHDIPRQFNWDSFVSWGGITTAFTRAINPKGPSETSDKSAFERTTNIISTLPYFAVGYHTIKNRKNLSGKLYGGSIIGVGATSALFHSTSGRWKSIAKKIDNLSVALSSSMMTKALFPKLSNSIWAMSLALIPFKPSLVSSANTLAMEVEFYRRTKENLNMKNIQKLHSGACVAGMGCLCVEEIKPETPLINTVWHLSSSVALATTNGLLEKVEEDNSIKSSFKNFNFHDIDIPIGRYCL